MNKNTSHSIKYTVGKGNNIKRVIVNLSIIDGIEITQEDIVKSLTEYICAFEDIRNSCA